jgi:hypothetical protein
MRAASLSLKLSQFKEAYGYYNSLAKKTRKNEYMKGLVSAAVGLKDPDKIIDACDMYLKKNRDHDIAITLAYAHETRSASRDASKKLADLNAALDAYKLAFGINPNSKIARDKIPELKIETLRLRKNLK